MDRSELDALRARNIALTEQVKRLIRTEQRLYRAQRGAAVQLQRIEALSEFAHEMVGVTDDEAVLHRGIDLLRSLFSYQQGVAFLAAADGAMVPVAVSAAPGCAERSEERLADRRPVVVDRDALPLGPAVLDLEQGSGPCPWRPLHERTEELFSPDDPATAERASSLLALPLRRERLLGAVLLRRLGRDQSLVEALPGPSDTAFLRLVTRHLESAVESAQMAGRIRTILEQLPGGVVVQQGGRVVFANRTVASMFGFGSPDEMVGAEVADLIHPDQRTEVAEYGAALLEGGQPIRTLERALVKRDGTRFAAETVAMPIVFDRAPAVMVIVEDLAERRSLRTQLAQAERLATVGALAAGVAHEINNPLAYVMLNLDALAREAGASGPAALRLQEARDGARRIRDIVRDLRTFARDEEEKAEAVDVPRVLDKVLAMAAQEMRYRARVVRDFGDGAVARAREGRLAQVFLNLVVNAAQAIEEGDVAGNEVRVSCRREGDEVVVQIADTGHGIPASDLPHVFEPFFSTKPRGVGSGLGLSISRNIVEGFGGRIAVDSAVGGGTRFTVRLPADDATARERAAAPAARARGGRRILVVDDEPRLCSVIADSLTDRHEVVTAVSGAAARQRLAAERFDVILCDVMMPGESGMDLHEWTVRTRPELAPRFVFMTGGTFTPRARDFLASVPNHCLDKPFDQDALERAIEAVLER